MKPWLWLGFAAVLFALGGCAKPAPPYDYTAFTRSKPRSILVLPPLNSSPEVKAGHGVLAQVAFPLAESGYYVFPVAVVEETFVNNGLTQADDIHAVSLEKLYDIFRADAVLYLHVREYGTRYQVVVSDTRVTLDGRLVDLRSGEQLWNGTATASSTEQHGTNQGGLAGLLAQALVEQIVHSVADTTYDIAGMADNRLLHAGQPHGLLYGPRSPLYGTDSGQAK
ncbi:MAG: DUF799 domain-containing protein [Desulfobulbus sp.]|nr:DUF799 domain-containing protein [Desulfobulbus sp.]